MKKVKFSRSVLVDGQHQQEGTTNELEDATAALLVADGSAVYVTEEEKEEKKSKTKEKE